MQSGQISGESRKIPYCLLWLEGPNKRGRSSPTNCSMPNTNMKMTGSEETLKAVTNTDWGLPRSALEQRRSDELMERREEVEEKTVPAQCRFLIVAAVTWCGKNRRFVVQMVGYGENGERWLIDRYNISHTCPTVMA